MLSNRLWESMWEHFGYSITLFVEKWFLVQKAVQAKEKCHPATCMNAYGSSAPKRRRCVEAEPCNAKRHLCLAPISFSSTFARDGVGGGLLSMGVGRIFSKGGQQGIFPKFFQGGPKVVKFDFSHLKLRKQPFLLKISKARGPWPPCLSFLTPMLFSSLKSEKNMPCIDSAF